MTAKRGTGVNSGKMPQPDQTIAELRTARDQLYSDMGSHPDAPIPWSVHLFVKKVDDMVGDHTPATNNGMEKVLSARGHKPDDLKHLIGQFLVQNADTLDYNAVFNAFPDRSHGYIEQCLAWYKHGKLELPSTDGIKYKVSGGRAMIIVSPVGKEPIVPEKIKSKKKNDRTLFCLYRNPGASDRDIAAYVGLDEKHAARMITLLRADGYVEKGSSKLTEHGVVYAVTLEKGATGEPLWPRFKAYLAASDGKDVGLDDAVAALPGERRSTVNHYLGFFARGQYKVDGYEISRVDGGKLHVKKLVAAPPAAAALKDPNTTVPPVVKSPDRTEYTIVLYAAEAGAIGDIYKERPKIKELIGDRVGFEQTVLTARNHIRPERVGRFYETVEKIPLDHGRMGNPHNYFFRLVLRDLDAAGKVMAWASQQGSITAEAFTAEMDKYKSTVAR